jgi:hypothetical protein
MTTQTFVNNSIAAYVGADADVVGVSGISGFPDWEGSSVYFVKQGSTPTCGFRKFNIDASGGSFQSGCDETLQRNIGSVGLSQISYDAGGAAILSYDGLHLNFISEPFNWDKITAVNTSDFSIYASFGISANIASEDGSHIRHSIGMVPLNVASSSNLMCASQSAAFISDVAATLASVTYFGQLTETGTALLSAGGAVTGNHKVYAIGTPGASGSVAAGQHAGVYTLDTGITRVGQFTPANVDATWTRITGMAVGAYDEGDGHIVIGVKTDEAVTHQAYIVKVSTTNGAILWATAVDLLFMSQWAPCGSRIRNHKFHYIKYPNTAYHINTTNGAVTTETITGLSLSLSGGGIQYSDDVTNSVIMFASFTAGGSPPDYVGAYMGAGGHHTIGDTWVRFWFATAGGGGGGDGGNQGGLTLSKKRAWTYTQDGHTFYVLDLAAEGTWVYDLSSKQWSQFQTTGFGQWDFQAGIQWNVNRVVGGDLSTTDMWELVPSATQDHDGALDIVHLVTGGVQTRSRVFNSVEAVRLSGSTGTIGSPTSSVMNLRFSDDNGKTWSAYYPITVTAGVEGEVEWRSLGAFDAPGRIFEVSDSGGMVRIDGCDAYIDNFDDDSLQQSG